MLGPRLFNIFINNIFMITEQSDICNFSDDMIPYTHVKMYKKADALRCIRRFLTIEKAKIMGNAFINSQFNYARLLSIFCRKSIYSKTENHKTLKIIYESNDTYDNLLLQSSMVSVHQRHLRFLITEI